MEDSIVQQLAVKYNISEEIIKKVTRSQFEFVKDTMEEGEFESVHLHYLGKFCVKPNRLKKLFEHGYEDRRQPRH